MNRLTPEIVGAAFAQTGMRPVQHTFGPSPVGRLDQPLDRCCGLYALAAARGIPRRPLPGETSYAHLAAAIGVPPLYAAGFAWGWDCASTHNLRDLAAPEYADGLKDGRSCWVALAGKGARNG